MKKLIRIDKLVELCNLLPDEKLLRLNSTTHGICYITDETKHYVISKKLYDVISNIGWKLYKSDITKLILAERNKKLIKI